MKNPCPSDFTFDDLEIHGPPSPEVTAHVAGCASCTRRRASREALQAEFRGFAAATWRGIEARIRRPTRRWAVALGVPALTAAALVVAFAARPPDRSPAAAVYTGIKAGFSLELFARRNGTVFRLEPGQPLAPGDEVRLRPLGIPEGARYILVGSVDGSGRFIPLYPARPAEQSLPLPPAGEPLAGAIRFDEAPGPERLIVLLSRQPVPAAAAGAAAEQAAPKLASIRSVAGVDLTSHWLVVPKRSSNGGGSPR